MIRVKQRARWRNDHRRGGNRSPAAMQYYDDLIRARRAFSARGWGWIPRRCKARRRRACGWLTRQPTQRRTDRACPGGRRMKDLFRIIVQLAIAHPNPEEMILVDGQFVAGGPAFVECRTGQCRSTSGLARTAPKNA